MITMDVRDIKWVGNMYQKFENMFMEAEEVMYEDTVKYIENQMQAVGDSVKKLYSEIMEDLLPPDEKAGIELPIDKRDDVEFCKKPFQVYKERYVKADAKQTTENSRIDSGVDNDAALDASNDRTSDAGASFMSSLRNSVKESNLSQYVGRMDVKSNLGIDQNQVNKKMAATEVSNETTSAETDACRTSQSREISNQNQNQNHGISVSKFASAEVARLASEADCSNEIENASIKQFPSVPVPVKSAEDKQIDTSSSSSSVQFGEPVEQGHIIMQQDHLKLEEACVMVNGDQIQLPPRKKKTRQTFSFSKKSARKQEYKELAAWHLNSEKVKGDCMENLHATLPQDQEKLLLPSMSEPEWELL